MVAGLLSWKSLQFAVSAPRSRNGFTSNWLTIRDIRTHYRFGRGPGAAGPPIVLLHGLAVSHRYLMPTARALAPYHPVYAPDLPGFGLSGSVPVAYHVGMHADHVATLLDRLGLDPVCAIGHSFGAEVAAALAARRPDQVRAIVLIGPTTDSAARSHLAQFRRFLWDLPREDPRQAAILVRDVRDAGIGRVIRTLSAAVGNQIERDLAATRVPTLLLRGAHDPIAPHRWLATLAGACGGPTATDSVPHAGHNAATTAGTAVAELIRRFLARWCP